MRYTPTAEAESQLWHVKMNDTFTGFDFWFCSAPSHSSPEGSHYPFIDHRLILASPESGLRDIRKLPGLTRATVYEDINSAYNAWLQSGLIDDRKYGLLAPYQRLQASMEPPLTVNLADLHNNPNNFHQPPVEAYHFGSNQGYTATGMPGGVEPEENGQLQPITSVPMASNPDLEEAEMKMEIGDNKPTKEEIDDFARNFREQNQAATVAICMHCRPGKNNRITDLKPTSLAVSRNLHETIISGSRATLFRDI
jgi:hypothetical protein